MSSALFERQLASAELFSSGAAASQIQITPTPFVWRDPATLPLRPWLLGRWLLAGTVAAVVAPGGVGKSSLMAAMLLSLGSGRPLLGKKVWGGPRRVWYWNLEDDTNELYRQVMAATLHFGVSQSEIDDRLWIDSGLDGQTLCVATEEPDGFKIIEPVMDALNRALTERGIDALIVDPFVSSHGLDENSNTKIDAVVKAWAKVARQAGCTVVLVHHTKKPAGQKVTAELSRGATALPNAARTTLVLNRMDTDEAAGFGITDDAERRLCFSVGDDKHNRAPPEKADWFRFQSVDLGNGNREQAGDSVGVVAPWTPPDAFDGLTGEDLYRVQLAVSEGEWRASEQVRDGSWVGVAVARTLGLDADHAHDKARIKVLLRSWLGNGALVVEQRKDANYVLRPFTVVGVWQNDASSNHYRSKVR